MTDLQADLIRIRDCAEQMASTLPRTRVLPGTVQARLVERATNLYHRAGSRIGIVFAGEYSAGKTALLCTLIGLPDLLPTGGPPTTANVTAIRLVPAPDGAAEPQHTMTSVTYLSVEAARTMVRWLIDRLTEHVRRFGLSYDLGPLAGYDPVDQGWERFDRLAESLWSQDGLNDTLREGLHELARVRDALRVGAHLLTDSERERPASPEAVHAALRIDGSRRLPASYPRLISALPVPADATLDAQVLRWTQPLLRRTTFEVQVPGTWSIGGLLARPGVELIDMPGLGTDSGRDEYLAEQELARATAVVVVVDAEHKPEKRDSINRILSLLEGSRSAHGELVHSRLVVANKFDRVPIASGPALASLDTATDKLTTNRRGDVVYTSVAAKLAGDGRRLPDPDVGGTPADLDEGRAGWGTWADEHPEDPAAAARRGYAVDGGIDFLRGRIVAHLNEQGLRVHVAELSEQRRLLFAELRSHLPTAAPRIGPDLEQRMTEMCRGLRESVQAMRAAVNALRTTPLTVDGSEQTEDLADHVTAIAVAEVYGWDVWPHLVERLSDDGVVQVSGAGPTGLLTRAADVVDDFEDVLARADHQLDEAFSAAVHGLLGGGPAPTTALHEDLLSVIGSGEQDGAAARSRIGLLRDVAALGFVERAVEGAVQQAPHGIAEQVCPLAPGSPLPWHPGLPVPADVAERRRSRDVHVLFRIRHDLADGIVQHVRRRLTVMNLLLVTQLDGDLVAMSAAVPRPREVRSLLADPSRHTSADTAERDDPLGELLDLCDPQPTAGTIDDPTRGGPHHD